MWDFFCPDFVGPRNADCTSAARCTHAASERLPLKTVLRRLYGVPRECWSTHDGLEKHGKARCEAWYDFDRA